MPVPYFGDFAEDDTVNIPFNTFDSNDPSASVTIGELADGDIHVHKDAHIDEIATDGATVVIDFDGITGNHMINIDTSVDAAYATGSEYQVRIEGTTVDGATVNGWVGTFSIERAGGVLARLETLITTVGAAGVGLTDINVKTITNDAITAASIAAAAIDNATFAADVGSTAHATNIISLAARKGLDDYDPPTKGELDTAQGAVTVSALGANVITAASIDGDAITEAKIADNAIAAEHIAAGAIDNATFAADVGSTAHATNIISLAARKGLDDFAPATKAEMDTAHGLLATEAKQDIIDTNIDQIETAVITNAAGVDVAADIIALKAETATILLDTGELQVDDIPGKLVAIDTLIDGIKAVTDALTAAAATKLALSAGTIIVAAAAAGTLSTTEMTTNLSEVTDDHYNGRIIIWTAGVLIGQATDITDYDGASKKLTYTATTEAPSDGDAFVIV